MQFTKKVAFKIAVLLLITTVTFFFFSIPGAWIGEIADLTPDSYVMIRQTTHTQDRSSGELHFVETVSDYDLSPVQIEMLQAYIRDASFMRSLRSTIYYNTTNLEHYNTFEIFISTQPIIRSENVVSVLNGHHISVTWGYYLGFSRGGDGWLQINDPSWEEALLQILSH